MWVVVAWGLIIPPSPQSLSADLNRLRQRQKWMSSSWDWGRSTSIEVIDCGAESESSTTSTHASLGQPYTPSLPDDSSDADSLWKDSTDSNPNSLQNSKDAGSVYQLETPESSIHHCHFGSLGRLVHTWFAGELDLKGIWAWESGTETSTVWCSKLPPFYFVWLFSLNMFMYNVAHDNFINCCWHRYLKHSGCCSYMASQTRVAAFSPNQKEISSKNNIMIMNPGRHIFDCNPFKTLTCPIPIPSFALFISLTPFPFCIRLVGPL